MDMIERVAAALWDDRHPDTSWDDDEKRDYMGHARAAIEAMREYTPEMHGAALSAAPLSADGPSTRQAWVAMIDAALKPET